MVYYPLPLQDQEAFRSIVRAGGPLEAASACAQCVLSLPMHTELSRAQQDAVIGAIGDLFAKR